MKTPVISHRVIRRLETLKGRYRIFVLSKVSHVPYALHPGLLPSLVPAPPPSHSPPPPFSSARIGRPPLDMVDVAMSGEEPAPPTVEAGAEHPGVPATATTDGNDGTTDAATGGWGHLANATVGMASGASCTARRRGEPPGRLERIFRPVDSNHLMRRRLPPGMDDAPRRRMDL